MKKILITLLIIFMLLCSAGSIFFFIRYKEYNNFKDSGVYQNMTFIIGDITIDASGKLPQEVFDEYILTFEKDIQPFVVTAGNKQYKIDIKKYCSHSIKESDFSYYSDDITFKEFLINTQKQYSLIDDYVYNGGVGKEIVSILQQEDYGFTKSADAYFDKENKEVIPEIYGTEINMVMVEDATEQAIINNQSSIDFNNENYYIKPNVTEDEIKEKFSKVLSLLEWEATYSVSDYVIKMSDYKDSITVNDDGSYKIDYSFLPNAVLELSKTVDNTYKSINFHAEKDGDIVVRGGTYGQIMKNTKEIDFLKEKIKNNEPVKDREPIWKCPPVGEENPDNYIEIDISAQHVWHYKDGKLCCETDCVTGDAGKKRDTPTGAYYVSEMIPGKYLVGEGYKTWVDRWMRLTNSGIGLHDASWKSKFGGKIYKTNGSHGCINLPTKYAYKLYDEIDVGLLVVIHE